MTTAVNVPCVLQAMREKGWTKRDTCVNCGIHWDSLNVVLSGRVPPRLPTWYRLLNGLGITEQEALISATAFSQKRLVLLHPRRSQKILPQHRQEGDSGI